MNGNNRNTKKGSVLHIGIIKWFHDQAKDANYGFIQHNLLGEVFFHAKNITQGQDIQSFKENTIVVFNIRESKKYRGEEEAINVRLIESENDLQFLIAYLLSVLDSKSKEKASSPILASVQARIAYLFKETKKSKNQQHFDYILNNIENKIKTEPSLGQNISYEILKLSANFPSKNHKQLMNTIERNISIELAHSFWLQGLLKTFHLDYISSKIFTISEHDKRSIFNKCSIEEKSTIFKKILFDLDRINDDNKLKTLKTTINLSVEYKNNEHDKFLLAALEICPDYYKLQLWLENYHEILDFNAYKLYIITLSPQDQKRFVKKVVKYIHEGKSTVTVDDITSITVMDFDTSKMIGKVDSLHLDYSTSIILNIISELKKNTKIGNRKERKLAKNKIYDIVLKQIKEPEDILEITGYFDECEGRCSVSIKEEKNKDGEIVNHEIIYTRNKFSKAKYHPICDGRKAIDKLTGKALLSDEKVEYWWCANQKCFKPSRTLHNPTDWEKYTLFDFLTILQIDFNETDLEIYLNIINKANRFLKHLKCRECNQILYPKGKSKYAFYGVSMFLCKNEKCKEKGNEIYLSHCLNGFCEMEIDSRDSVKCKPKGVEQEKCGWYVCNHCNSCCNTQQLERRKLVYDNLLREKYSCHTVGHKDLGIISCNKCGDIMEPNKPNPEFYNKVLSWFISNRENSSYIGKSGKNKLGKWWFSFLRGNLTKEIYRIKLNEYRNIGFQVPNINENRDNQLISEPINHTKQIDNIFTCIKCGNILDLNIDYEQAHAVKQYHILKFPQKKE